MSWQKWMSALLLVPVVGRVSSRIRFYLRGVGAHAPITAALFLPVLRQAA